LLLYGWNFFGFDFLVLALVLLLVPSLVLLAHRCWCCLDALLVVWCCFDALAMVLF
jgi:hypothetical protein